MLKPEVIPAFQARNEAAKASRMKRLEEFKIKHEIKLKELARQRADARRQAYLARKSAAVRFQALFRGFTVRQTIERWSTVVTRFQRWYQRCVARRVAREMRQMMLAERRELTRLAVEERDFRIRVHSAKVVFRCIRRWYGMVVQDRIRTARRKRL